MKQRSPSVGLPKSTDCLSLVEKSAASMVTLGDTVIYGVFMILVLVVYLSRIRRLEYLNLLGAAILFFFIARSYSRAATFSALLAGGAWFFFHHGWKKTLRLGLAIVLIFGILLVVVNPFSLEYINPPQSKSWTRRQRNRCIFRILCPCRAKTASGGVDRECSDCPC